MRATLFVLALVVGCGSLPEITFVPDGTDAASPTDGGTGSDGSAADGAASSDGAIDTGPVDSGPPTCPNPDPANAVTCCQQQFCSGQCPTQGNASRTCATDCNNRGCVSPMVCCRAGGEYRGCVAIGQRCPN